MFIHYATLEEISIFNCSPEIFANYGYTNIYIYIMVLTLRNKVKGQYKYYFDNSTTSGYLLIFLEVGV